MQYRPNAMSDSSFGKGVGDGETLVALDAREAVCCFEHGDQGGTCNGNPLMAAVGCAVMEAVSVEGFLEGVRESGECLMSGLR